MQINSRDAGEIKVVELDGNLDGITSPDAQNHLDALINGGANKILVSFEKVNYVSSAGLRVLLVTAKQLRSKGGDLRLCSLNRNVQEVFDISGFSSILSLHGSEGEALEGF